MSCKVAGIQITSIEKPPTFGENDGKITSGLLTDNLDMWCMIQECFKCPFC